MTDQVEVVVGMAEVVVAVSTGPAVAVSVGPAEDVVAVSWFCWGGGGTAEDVDWAEATDDGRAWVLHGNRPHWERSFQGPSVSVESHLCQAVWAKTCEACI